MNKPLVALHLAISLLLLCTISACGIKRDLIMPEQAIKKQQEKEAKAKE
jgi:predicted small lipoprotein YifL